MALEEIVTAPRPTNPGPREHDTALPRWLFSACVIVVYCLLGIVAFWPIYPGISQRLFSPEGDFTQSVWYLDWIPNAIAHGLNPFFSRAIFVPTGVNLAQNTASPLLGLFTAPFAPVLNLVVRANLLMLLGMPASATAAFVVLRKWKVWGPAAALGGLIYGFSPYMISQGLGHVELIFVPLPPFIALTIVSILQGVGSPRRLGIQLGLLVAAQYLISPEVLATVVIFALAAVTCVAIARRDDLAELGRTALGPLGLALAVSAVLLAYPVWMLVAGPQHFTGPTVAIPNQFHNDLLNFVVPGPAQRVSLGMRSVAVHLDVGSIPTEIGGYIGVPLLILMGILVWFSRRSPRTQLTAILLVGAALLSLGPQLTVDGHLTGIPLPFLLLEHLPFLDNILPSRMSFEEDAFLAALIAFGLDDLRRAALRGNEHAVARRWLPSFFVVATLAVLILTQLPPWPYTDSAIELQGHVQPATGLPSNVLRAIPAGDPVTITYPYSTFLETQPMLWQAEDGFDFRLLGGYAYHPDASGHTFDADVMNPPGLQQFLANQSGRLAGFGDLFGPSLPVSPKLVTVARTALSTYDVQLVIVDRSAAGAVRSWSCSPQPSALPRSLRARSPCGPTGTAGRVTSSSCRTSSRAWCGPGTMPTCQARRCLLPRRLPGST